MTFSKHSHTDTSKLTTGSLWHCYGHSPAPARTKRNLAGCGRFTWDVAAYSVAAAPENPESGSSGEINSLHVAAKCNRKLT